MSPWLLGVLVIGATYRVTRLLTRDQLPLVARPREQLVGYWYPDFAERDWRDAHPGARAHWGGLGHSLAYLITCDWCVSMYVSTGMVAAAWYWSPWLRPWGWLAATLLGLTASAVTGLIASREPD